MQAHPRRSATSRLHPGAVDSSMSAALDSSILTYIRILTLFISCVFFFARSSNQSFRIGLRLKLACFFLEVRWFDSLDHNISPRDGAAAAVYACLAPLAFIPVFCLPLGYSLREGRSIKKARSRYACTL